MMELKMTEKQFRRLLDLVYIGNWVLNSTRATTASRSTIRWRALCSPTVSITAWHR